MGKFTWDVVSAVVGVPVGLLCVLYLFLRLRKKKRVLDKVVLITGSTSGLGRACAKVFMQAGCRVILAGRSIDKLSETCDGLKRELGQYIHQPKVILMDLEDIPSLQEKAFDALQFYGRIDILINNAGISYRGEIEETSLEVDRKVMLVNYFGQIAITKAILPSMLMYESGHIVGISSIQGKISIPFRSAYSASKHAFQAFLDCLRAEVADRNIDVSVVSPSYIHTNLSKNAVRSDGTKHGVTDSSTANGMDPLYVAKQVLYAVEYNQPDVLVATIVPKLACYLRFLFPKTYFSSMRSRARKQRLENVKKK